MKTDKIKECKRFKCGRHFTAKPVSVVMFWKVLLCVFLLTSCSQQKVKKDEIDLESAYDQKSQLLLSDFAERIEYIALETKDHPIDRSLTVYTAENYLVCIAFRQIYLFDRQTGKFIKEIGKYGRGPEEYMATRHFDYKLQHIIALGNGRDLYEYDLNGKVNRTILYPQKEIVTKKADGFFDDQWWLSGQIFLDNNTIVYYNDNITGDATDRLLIVDEKGKVLKSFANHNHWVRKDMNVSYRRPVFYHYGGSTFFFENFVDTIYRISRDELTPQFRLKMDKYKPPYEIKGSTDPLHQYFILSNIGESDRFLFFEIGHDEHLFFGFYDKKTEKSQIADIDKTDKKRRIVNDIDNFSSFQFDSWNSWSINEQNQMITFIEAGDVVEWFENNKTKAGTLPPALQKLAKIGQEDNPVAVIITLKQ